MTTGYLPKLASWGKSTKARCFGSVGHARSRAGLEPMMPVTLCRLAAARAVCGSFVNALPLSTVPENQIVLEEAEGLASCSSDVL